jgi:hypothetical protein
MIICVCASASIKIKFQVSAGKLINVSKDDLIVGQDHCACNRSKKVGVAQTILQVAVICVR